jgi:hypothetical protein
VADVPVKRCSKCEQGLPASSFYAGRRAHGVELSSWCRSCHQARDRKRKAELRAMPEREVTVLPLSEMQGGPVQKRCERCRQVKPVSAYGADFSKAFGLSARCLSCEMAQIAASPGEAAAGAG